jgi:hypothetical protein
MINQLYLTKAANIRRDYIEITTNIKKYETIAHELAETISVRMKDLESLLENINANKISNIDSAKSELETIMINTEMDMNKVDSQIDQLVAKMDTLAQDEKTLYRDIKQTYPEKSDEDLRQEVQAYLKEENIS